MLVCLSVPTSLHLRRRRGWLQLSISVEIHVPSRHEKRWTLLTMTFEFKLSRRITSTLVSGNKRQPMTYTPGLGGREMLGGDGSTERIERHDPFQTTQRRRDRNANHRKTPRCGQNTRIRQRQSHTRRTSHIDVLTTTTQRGISVPHLLAIARFNRRQRGQRKVKPKCDACGTETHDPGT